MTLTIIFHWLVFATVHLPTNVLKCLAWSTLRHLGEWTNGITDRTTEAPNCVMPINSTRLPGREGGGACWIYKYGLMHSARSSFHLLSTQQSPCTSCVMLCPGWPIRANGGCSTQQMPFLLSNSDMAHAYSHKITENSHQLLSKLAFIRIENKKCSRQQ